MFGSMPSSAESSVAQTPTSGELDLPNFQDAANATCTSQALSPQELAQSHYFLDKEGQNYGVFAPDFNLEDAAACERWELSKTQLQFNGMGMQCGYTSYPAARGYYALLETPLSMPASYETGRLRCTTSAPFGAAVLPPELLFEPVETSKRRRISGGLPSADELISYVDHREVLPTRALVLDQLALSLNNNPLGPPLE